jgi:hypothetical protein
MSAAIELVRAWNREGVNLNKGADVVELAALRECLGSEGDGQLWELYSLANGMVDHEYDARQVSFWSVDKIVNVATEDTFPHIAFADFLIDSWYFRLERSASGLVVLSDNVRPGTPPENLGSFAEFLRAYLDRPTALGVFAPAT